MNTFGTRLKHLISRSGFKDIHRDGTLELGIGIVLSIFAFDRYLQHKKQEKALAVHEEKTRVLQQFLSADRSADNSQSTATDQRISIIENAKELEDKSRLLETINQIDLQQRTAMRQEHLNSKAQFQCQVRKVPPENMFDGNKSLVGVEVGDVLDVLEEGVGPGKLYNLCRTTKSQEAKQVGWYPVWFLEKISIEAENKEIKT